MLHAASSSVIPGITNNSAKYNSRDPWALLCIAQLSFVSLGWPGFSSDSHIALWVWLRIFGRGPALPNIKTFIMTLYCFPNCWKLRPPKCLDIHICRHCKVEVWEVPGCSLKEAGRKDPRLSQSFLCQQAAVWLVEMDSLRRFLHFLGFLPWHSLTSWNGCLIFALLEFCRILEMPTHSDNSNLCQEGAPHTSAPVLEGAW